MRLLAALLLCLALPVQAEGFLTRLLNKPVPGGVAVVALPEQPQAPQARYQGKPVLVVREDGRRWIAIVGIPLTVKPGQQQIEITGAQPLPFEVGSKRYQEQHIRLKNQEQVNPSPANLKRIERELAEQTRTYQQFSPGTPSNLLLDKPVNGPLSSRFGVRRFFNGEERNPHAGLDFAVPAGTPVKAPAAGKVHPDWRLLLQRQDGVRRSWSGPDQHVLPPVEDRCPSRPATPPRRRARPRRRNRSRHRPTHALERQPE